MPVAMYIGIKKAENIPEALRSVEGVDIRDQEERPHILIGTGVPVCLSGDNYRIGSDDSCVLVHKDLVSKLDVY